MLIAVDIDDTLSMTSNSFLEYALMYDKSLRGNGIIRDNGHNIYNRFDWSIEEYNNFYKQYEALAIMNAKVFPYAKDVIDRLKLLGNKCAIITARNEDKSSNLTSKWLEQNDLKFDYIIYNSMYKGYAALALGAKYFLDDTPYHCEDVASMDIKTYIFTSMKNKEYYHKNIERVESWLDFYQKITGEELDVKRLTKI